MGFWTVLGGMAAGVGAVALLPVAGPIGAVTALGAAIGAGVGGLAGAVASATEEEERGNAANEGRLEERAEHELREKKLAADLEELKGRLSDDAKYEKVLLALFAVGIATANCDGEIHPREREDIDAFVAGVASVAFSPRVKEAIQDIYTSMPNLNTAMKFVKQAEFKDLGIVDQVIEMVIGADGIEHEQETAFRDAWTRCKMVKRNRKGPSDARGCDQAI